MRKFYHHKIGDTLIEVSLAVGIFSMVAIAVVSVVSGSSSSTQAALETTITREEMDSQAEAIRFIHAAYNASGDVGGGDEADKYRGLWGRIVENAIDPATASSEIVEAVTKYNPSTCSELYKEGSDANYIGNQHAFIINTKKLNSGNVDEIVIRSDGTGKDKFRQAATYPRLVYNGDSDALYDEGGSTLEYVEGIYIIAVKDPNSTAVVSGGGSEGQTQNISAYYDFYIHTCWFNPNEERPSTISTVIRLYDPGTISSGQYSNKIVTIKYDGNGANSGSMSDQSVLSSRKIALNKNNFERSGHRFMGWSTSPDATEPMYFDQGAYQAVGGLTENKTITLYAVWGYVYTLTYYDTDMVTPLENCRNEHVTTDESYEFKINCPKPSPPGNGKEFRGWATNTSGTGDWYTADGANDTKTKIVATTAPGTQNIKLYPVWRKIVEFSSNIWTKDSSSYTGSSETCKIFQVNEPSPGATKYNAGYTWWSSGDKKNVTPMKGYLVESKGGQHIEMFENGINFQGYCKNKSDITEGVHYDQIDENDTFELSFKMDTSSMSTHPGGYVNISIGPLNAAVTDGGKIRATCGDSSKTSSFTSGTRIKLTKYGNEYAITIGDGANSLVSCNDNSADISVKYSMTHGDHNCSKVFSVLLTDISMTQVVK